MQAQQVTSVKELVRTLGGTTPTAVALGTTPQNVGHWVKWDVIPPVHYKRHREKLLKLRIKAPDTLWGFAEAAE